jgi:hypothetical protein
MARPHALPGIPAVPFVGRQQHLAAVWDGAGQSFQKDRRAEPTGDAAQKRRTQHWVRVPVGYVLPIPGRGPHAPELFKETNMIQISKRIKQREQLALALLQQPSLEKAAAAVGISTTTAWRIGKTPEFEEQFERARRDAYDQMSSRLQYGAAKAVDILLDVMKNPRAPHACKVRAADTMLHHATKAKEMDVDARLDRLERTPVKETQP